MASETLKNAAAQASAAVAERSPQGTMRDLINRQRPGIEAALPQHVNQGAYMRAVLTEISRTPKLATTTPASFFGALMTAAQLGLMPVPALGEAYLVPYGRETQLIIGYQGWLDLFRRSGMMKSISVKARHANDKWVLKYGMDEDEFVHEPAEEGQRGPVLGYYLIARFKDGGHHFDYMPLAKIEERRKRSKASNNGPWVTDYEAMCMKTVVRANARWLPKSTEIAQALASDGAVLNQRGDDIVPEFPDEEPAELPKADADGVIETRTVPTDGAPAAGDAATRERAGGAAEVPQAADADADTSSPAAPPSEDENEDDDPITSIEQRQALGDEAAKTGLTGEEFIAFVNNITGRRGESLKGLRLSQLMKVYDALEQRAAIAVSEEGGEE